MIGVLYVLGIIAVLILVYTAARLAGLGWYTSQKEIFKRKTKVQPK